MKCSSQQVTELSPLLAEARNTYFKGSSLIIITDEDMEARPRSKLQTLGVSGGAAAAALLLLLALKRRRRSKRCSSRTGTVHQQHLSVAADEVPVPEQSEAPHSSDQATSNAVGEPFAALPASEATCLNAAAQAESLAESASSAEDSSEPDVAVDIPDPVDQAPIKAATETLHLVAAGTAAAAPETAAAAAADAVFSSRDSGKRALGARGMGQALQGLKRVISSKDVKRG